MIQDQSRGWTRWVLDWFRPSRRVIVLCSVLSYYAVEMYEFACPRRVAGCYFYTQKNHLIDMVSFWLCYNLNKYISDRDSILGLHPASWAVAVIRPLIRMNIYGIVTSPWICRQPDHLGSRSDCQAIGTTDRTPLWTSSLLHRVHFFFTPNSDFDPPMFLQPDVILGWWSVRYTLTSHPQVSIIAWQSHLWVLFSENLNRLHTLRTTHGSRNNALKWALQNRGDVGYYDSVAPLGL
jgi:hypothetical protein